MKDNKTELILVYNAESGFFNIIKDALHKTVSPSTYQCNLCTLTYGMLTMKSKWRNFIGKLDIPSKFLHRNEFYELLKTHPHNIKNARFPSIYLHKGNRISLFITINEINQCKTLSDLTTLITKKLSQTHR